MTSTGSIAPPWQPQAALEEGPDEVETGGQGAGQQCWVTDSPQEPPPPAVVEVERKGAGQGSQVTLGFYGERPENQANGREGGREGQPLERRPGGGFGLESRFPSSGCKPFLVCVYS